MIPGAKTSRRGDHLRWGESMREDIEGGQARLIDAALFCYRRFGPQHTRVVDIALQAHVTRVTFYRYFRNAEDLLRATLKRELGRLWESATEQVTDSGAAGVADTVLAFLELIRQPDHHYLAHPGMLPALGACMLDRDYLTRNASILLPLRTSLPPGGSVTLFEIMNRTAFSYLHTPSPVFHTGTQLRNHLARTVAPFVAWLQASQGEIRALRPAALHS